MDPFTLGSGFGFGALLVGIIFAVICSSTAKERDRSAGWWGVWGFLTTFIALIVLVLLPRKPRPDDADDHALTRKATAP